MKSLKDGYGYNERLFSGGLRSKSHFARFQRFLSEVARLKCSTDSILGLGCFDGKLINFLRSKLSRYIGFDANWEGGLGMAKARWIDKPHFSFFQTSTPKGTHLKDNETF